MKWQAIRTKGQTRFLLAGGLPWALGATLAEISRWIWRYGFSVSLVLRSAFLLEVGMTFITVYAVVCFGQMIRWRKNEQEFREEVINVDGAI
jgi:hypothetical protein